MSKKHVTLDQLVIAANNWFKSWGRLVPYKIICFLMGIIYLSLGEGFVQSVFIIIFYAYLVFLYFFFFLLICKTISLFFLLRSYKKTIENLKTYKKINTLSIILSLQACALSAFITLIPTLIIALVFYFKFRSFVKSVGSDTDSVIAVSEIFKRRKKVMLIDKNKKSIDVEEVF